MTQQKFSGDEAVPLSIRQVGNLELGIHWKDGHESIYAGHYLRNQCACAGCIDEWSGKSLLNVDAISKEIHPTDIKSVGRYGIQIFWSDGHSTGIYTFDRLRELCPCNACQHK